VRPACYEGLHVIRICRGCLEPDLFKAGCMFSLSRSTSVCLFAYIHMVEAKLPRARMSLLGPDMRYNQACVSVLVAGRFGSIRNALDKWHIPLNIYDKHYNVMPSYYYLYVIFVCLYVLRSHVCIWVAHK
jgi:hypothetical protein